MIKQITINKVIINLDSNTDLNKAGIYLIINKDTRKTYVGQTNNLLTRKRTHKRSLEKGTHYNSALQKDYARHTFVWVAIKNYPIEMLNRMEIYWIKKLDTFNNGYNQTIGGDTIERGDKHWFYDHTVYTWYHRELAPNGIDATQFELRTNIDSTLESSHISGIVQGVQKSHCGWCLDKEYSKTCKIYTMPIRIWYHRELAPDGVEMLQHELIKKYNVSSASQVVTGKMKSANGWTLSKEYINHSKVVKTDAIMTWYHRELAPDGIEKSPRDLTKEYFLYTSALVSVISKKIPHHKGWTLSKESSLSVNYHIKK